MNPDDYTVTPTEQKFRFLKKHVKEGLLPIILKDLLSARKKAKNLLKEAKAKVKEAKNPEEKEEWENLVGVYNGR